MTVHNDQDEHLSVPIRAHYDNTDLVSDKQARWLPLGASLCEGFCLPLWDKLSASIKMVQYYCRPLWHPGTDLKGLSIKNQQANNQHWQH